MAPRPEWMTDAACAEVGGDAWFAEKSQWADVIQAKLVCRRCPVREQCLSYALQNNEMHGVWGGMSPKQRFALRTASRRGLAS